MKVCVYQMVTQERLDYYNNTTPSRMFCVMGNCDGDGNKGKKEWPSNCSVFLEKDPGLFRHTAASYFITEKLQHSKAE